MNKPKPQVKKLLKKLSRTGIQGPVGPSIGNLGASNAPKVKPLTEEKKEKLASRALKKAGRKAARKVRREWSGQFDRPPLQ